MAQWFPSFGRSPCRFLQIEQTIKTSNNSVTMGKMGPECTADRIMIQFKRIIIWPMIFTVQWNTATSIIRLSMPMGKSDLNGEVTVLQGAKLHCGIQFGTAKGDPNGKVTLLVR